MAPITGSVEIARSPQDVFDYVTDIERQAEWQEAIVDVKVETEGPTRVGTRAVETRRVPGGTRTFPFEITEHDPPRRSGFQVKDGPVRPHGTITFTPLDEGARTRVDFEIEFEGHGLGALLLPIVNRDARKIVPNDLALLKQRLESAD
jgi:uncharacterized protein YndB with AHSA1/START domain